MTKADDAAIASLGEKLAAFRESLDTAERDILDDVLSAAASSVDGDEVSGFDAVADMSKNSGLFFSILSNIINTRQETNRTITKNLRG